MFAANTSAARRAACAAARRGIHAGRATLGGADEPVRATSDGERAREKIPAIGVGLVRGRAFAATKTRARARRRAMTRVDRVSSPGWEAGRARASGRWIRDGDGGEGARTDRDARRGGFCAGVHSREAHV